MTQPTSIALRVALPNDTPTLNQLIQESARELSVGFYTPQETEAAIRHVFGVDSTLVADRSYFVAECDGEIAGCGGWSRRRTLYGGDQRPVGGAAFLDPAVDAAKVRAFFVSPRFARRGIGSALLDACADAAWHVGFRKLELMATLPGVPLYGARGFIRQEDVVDSLPDGTPIRFVRMTRPLTSTPLGRFRLADSADAESVAALHIASWQSAYRRLLPDDFLASLDLSLRTSAWRESMRHSGMHVVLREVVGSGLVAFCAIAPSRDSGALPSTWEIWNLHAAPTAQGKGYGAQLFDAAVEIARTASAEALTLWVVDENSDARRFYERHGMSLDGLRQTHELAPNVSLNEVRYRLALDVAR